MLKCSFPTCRCGRAVQLLCSLIPPTQSQKPTAEHLRQMGAQLSPGLFGKQTWRPEHNHHGSVQPQPFETLNISTLHPLSYQTHLFNNKYLGLQLLLQFESLLELNLYALYLFFSLKLPKILHKGKLCSLFYALSDEAKYPLIVDQRRRKNLGGLMRYRLLLT